MPKNCRTVTIHIVLFRLFRHDIKHSTVLQKYEFAAPFIGDHSHGNG